MDIALYLLEILIGAAILGFSADRFIDASVSLAKLYKIPTLVIGLVLVGFGTSLPELVVSLLASLHDNAEIAVGNVVGSNIANIGLVLGTAALITPITVNSRLIKRELPTLIIVSLIIGLMFLSGKLTLYFGIILLLILILHLYWIITKKSDSDPIISQVKQEIKHVMKKKPAIIWWGVALALVLVSSEVLLRGAINLARHFNISELVIGLTIVTLGTSLPEFVITLLSALKKEHDVAVGHIIGSNLFNSLAVLAMPALFAPGPLPQTLFHRDYVVMLLFTLCLWALLFAFNKRRVINRLFGALLLLGYIGYLLALTFG